MNQNNKAKYILILYVAGKTPNSIKAIENLQKICEEYLHGQYTVEVIDLSKNPERASKDQILALPALVRQLPEPLVKIIGDLSNKEKVLLGLNLKPL